MKLKPSWVKAFQAGMVAVSETADTLKGLQELAKVEPAIAGDVRELVEMSEHLETLCATALSLAD